EMYMTIGRGRGYSPAEDNKTDDQPIGVIPIDSIFSPIRRAAYRVDSARVGQRTDFDKLSLEVETDSSLEPPAALREASELLIASLAIFTDAERVDELTQLNHAVSNGDGADLPTEGGGDDRLIEELEIGVRAYNCLKRAGVQTIGDLQAKSESELKAIPNFGERSIEEVIEAMHGLGLNLRDE
ncbi:MAG: DNA-directed RNA polymerase subunit alpha, partial [Solirubrobacterales bacterium]|nr:DNA-directed RNA polymerase subunit alpha [Solirubrobacterales bacterium]